MNNFLIPNMRQIYFENTVTIENQQLLYYSFCCNMPSWYVYVQLIFLKRSSQLVEFVDIFPTLVEAAGMWNIYANK